MTDPGFVRVRRTSAAGDAARSIQEMIVDGRLAPGQRLPAERELAERLGVVRDRLGLEAITFNDVGELPAEVAHPTHVLSVYGSDHPGIVHSVTAALAERGVNITDLETRVTGGDEPLYAMIMEVALGEAEAAGIEEALREVAGREQVEVSLRPIDSDAL